MTRIEAGIFDIGGVLISDEMAHVRRDIVQTLGVEEEVFGAAWSEIVPLLGNGQIEEDEFWRRVVERTAAPGTLPAQSLFLREYVRRYRPHQEVLDLAARLKALGLQTAVLSNTITTHVTHNRTQGLFAPFDVLVFTNEVGVGKPDARIYRHTLEQLGLADRPEATFFVDDRQENVDAANALGIHGILFTNPATLVAEVRKLGLEV
jgi:epoxide hydrolase-like predicted phosphatase